MSVKGKAPGVAYATKGNIRHPGTQAEADAAERKAEDVLEDYLGLGSTALLNVLTITPAS